MISSKRIFPYLILVTALIFVYVHQQISILRISYSIEKKERELARISEEFKVARYQLARLKSPSYLSRQIKERSLNLAPPKMIEVVKVPTVKTNAPDVQTSWPAKSVFLSWVGSIKEAQAKTSK